MRGGKDSDGHAVVKTRIRKTNDIRSKKEIMRSREGRKYGESGSITNNKKYRDGVVPEMTKID